MAARPRLSRRPTLRGVVLMLCGLALFLLATHFASNAIFLLAFFCISLPLAAPFAAWNAAARVTVHPLPPGQSAVGEPAEMRFRLTPAPRSRARLVLDTAQGPAHAHTHADANAHANAQGAVSDLWVLRREGLPRGLHEVGPVFVKGLDPLGLFRADRPLSRQEAQGLAPLVVHPRPDWTDPALPSAADPARPRMGQGDDAAGLRPWRPGDRRRDVDWRASARTDGLIVREYEQSQDDRACIFDLGPTSGPTTGLTTGPTSGPQLEAALSRLTAGVLDAARNGRPIGLRLPGVDLPPKEGPAHLAQIMTELAAVPAR